MVFSEPDFSENNTFLLSDWLAHTPKDIVAANFKKNIENLDPLPKSEKYIFSADVPGTIEEVIRPNSKGNVPRAFTFHMKEA